MCKSSCVSWDFNHHHRPQILLFHLPQTVWFLSRCLLEHRPCNDWLHNTVGREQLGSRLYFSLGNAATIWSNWYSFFSRNIIVTSNQCIYIFFFISTNSSYKKIIIDRRLWKTTIATERSHKQEKAGCGNHELLWTRDEVRKKCINMLCNNWKLPLSSATREISFVVLIKGNLGEINWELLLLEEASLSPFQSYHLAMPSAMWWIMVFIGYIKLLPPCKL